jgi:hypothetical protein
MDFSRANAWQDVSRSKTWAEWLKNSEEMIDQLKALL